MTEHSSEHHTSPRPRPSARRRGRAATHDHGTPQNRALWLGVAIAFAAIMLLVAVDAISSAGRIHPGVSVGGVALGGQTPADALATLQTDLPKKASASPVTVVQGSTTWQVSTDDIAATFDYQHLVDSAMAVGRTGSFFATVGERVHSWFGGTALPAPATADPQKLAGTIAHICSTIDQAPKNASLKVKVDSVTIRPSATGIAVDRVKLQTDLLNAFTAETRTVKLVAATAQPKIDDAAAKVAQGVVQQMISATATVTYKGKTWPLSTSEIVKMIAFQQVETTAAPTGWVLDPVIGAKEASNTIVPKVGAALGNPPVDARFKTQGGKVTIVPSKMGTGPDVEQFASTLTDDLKTKGTDRSVELQTKTTAPKLTTEAAKAMGIHTRISTFTTTYGGSIPTRINNIHVLGAALDGKLVPPGGTFSLNGAVGERTAAKGYQEAFAIVQGKLVPQLGGGICQVATTLFNAVFFTGFPVLERVNHSFYLSHYPTGRDATVSWGGPDLRWKNPTNNWVLVSVAYTSDSITVSIYGTSPGYTVSYTTGPLQDGTPFKVIKVNDPTLAVGQTKVVDTGVNGKKVVVTRTVKKGGSVIRTDTFTSNYTPKDETLNVGTKAVAPPSKPATTTPAPKKKP